MCLFSHLDKELLPFSSTDPHVMACEENVFFLCTLAEIMASFRKQRCKDR